MLFKAWRHPDQRLSKPALSGCAYATSETIRLFVARNPEGTIGG